MKVLMFGWEFPPYISGGLGTACYGLTKGLISFGDINLTFVVPKSYGDEDIQGMKLIGANEVKLSEKILYRQKKLEMSKFQEMEQQISGYVTPEQYRKILIEQKELNKDKVLNTPVEKLEFTGKYGNDLFKEISRYAVVASEIARVEPHDVIHAHDWLTYPSGIQAKKVSGRPLVVHVHATEYDRCGENYNKKVYEIERQGMEIADKVITVSNFTRNTVINKYHIDSSKVVTIHNAVEPVYHATTQNFWKNKTNEKIVTFLGRITRQKGPGYFIEAAYKVIQKMDNVRFVMAGSGDLMEDMIKQVARLKISDRFHFSGFLKGEDVFRMFSMSDLYVMPSVSEPFGISPLEAIQSNVPVIISKQSGVSEVITKAIKVDFWDVEALADAIYGVLNYHSLANFLKINSKQEVNLLTWDRVALKVKELYNQVA